MSRVGARLNIVRTRLCILDSICSGEVKPLSLYIHRRVEAYEDPAPIKMLLHVQHGKMTVTVRWKGNARQSTHRHLYHHSKSTASAAAQREEQIGVPAGVSGHVFTCRDNDLRLKLYEMRGAIA